MKITFCLKLGFFSLLLFIRFLIFFIFFTLLTKCFQVFQCSNVRRFFFLCFNRIELVMHHMNVRNKKILWLLLLFFQTMIFFFKPHMVNGGVDVIFKAKVYLRKIVLRQWNVLSYIQSSNQHKRMWTKEYKWKLHIEFLW